MKRDEDSPRAGGGLRVACCVGRFFDFLLAKGTLIYLWIFRHKDYVALKDKKRLEEAKINMANHCATDEDWRLICEEDK